MHRYRATGLNFLLGLRNFSNLTQGQTALEVPGRLIVLALARRLTVCRVPRDRITQFGSSVLAVVPCPLQTWWPTETARHGLQNCARMNWRQCLANVVGDRWRYRFYRFSKSALYPPPPPIAKTQSVLAHICTGRAIWSSALRVNGLRDRTIFRGFCGLVTRDLQDDGPVRAQVD
jgi:hypothetical protein